MRRLKLTLAILTLAAFPSASAKSDDSVPGGWDSRIGAQSFAAPVESSYPRIGRFGLYGYGVLPPGKSAVTVGNAGTGWSAARNPGVAEANGLIPLGNSIRRSVSSTPDPLNDMVESSSLNVVERSPTESFLALLKAHSGSPKTIAHRGDSYRAPENTLEAAELAFQSGAFAWELDVHLSRDGIPVVIHDDSLRRTTNVESIFQDDIRALTDYQVSDFHLEELLRLDCGVMVCVRSRRRKIEPRVPITNSSPDRHGDAMQRGARSHSNLAASA